MKIIDCVSLEYSQLGTKNDEHLNLVNYTIASFPMQIFQETKEAFNLKLCIAGNITEYKIYVKID